MAESKWKWRRRRKQRRLEGDFDCIKIHILLIFLAWGGTTIADDARLSGNVLDGIFDYTDTLTCRLLLMDTLFETPDGSLRTEEEIKCVPILPSGRENDHPLAIQLPSDFVEANDVNIRSGQLLVSISGAARSATNQEVNLSRDSTISIVPRGSDSQAAFTGRRVLDLQTNKAAGPLSASVLLTVTVLRVSAIDSYMNRSATEISSVLFGEGRINFVSQFAACSFGALLWTPSKYGVLDVFLNQTLDEMSRDSSVMIYRALESVRLQFNLGSVTELSDHVMVCLPPGTGDWAANAGVNYWRAHFNDQWCTSLSATMHELGHNLGLLHSNEQVYYGDSTGYMAAGYKNTDWPRRCFNAQNHWYLGWYPSRRRIVDPRRDDAQLIRLAAFVDYDQTSDNETVLVKVMDRFYVQYNRAKGINKGTGEKRNQVVITEEGSGGTESLGGLSAGQSFVLPTADNGEGEVVVEVCGKESGGRHGPDVMIVGISREASLCSTARAAYPVQVPTGQPSSTPTLHLRQKVERTPRSSPSLSTINSNRASSHRPTTPGPSRRHRRPPSYMPSVDVSAGPSSSCGGLRVVCNGTAPVPEPDDYASAPDPARTVPSHRTPLLLQILFAPTTAASAAPPSSAGKVSPSTPPSFPRHEAQRWRPSRAPSQQPVVSESIGNATTAPTKVPVEKEDGGVNPKRLSSWERRQGPRSGVNLSLIVFRDAQESPSTPTPTSRAPHDDEEVEGSQRPAPSSAWSSGGRRQAQRGLLLGSGTGSGFMLLLVLHFVALPRS